MAKRKIVEVDEDAIKKMIAGDIPSWVPNNTLAEEKENQNDDDHNDKQNKNLNTNYEDIDNEGSELKTTRKRKNKLKYSDFFLIQQRYSETKQTTIIFDKRIYSSIRNILKTTDGITLANFVNNVLIHHFNEYKEDIDELKKEYISNLYNDK